MPESPVRLGGTGAQTLVAPAGLRAAPTEAPSPRTLRCARGGRAREDGADLQDAEAMTSHGACVPPPDTDGGPAGSSVRRWTRLN